MKLSKEQFNESLADATGKTVLRVSHSTTMIVFDVVDAVGVNDSTKESVQCKPVVIEKIPGLDVYDAIHLRALIEKVRG